MAYMSKRYSPLYLVVMTSVSCVGIYCPFVAAEAPDHTASTALPSVDVNTTQQVSVAAKLEPMLVGIVVNGKEQESLDALYNPNVDDSLNSNNTAYFLSVSDLSRLTAIRFSSLPTSSSAINSSALSSSPKNNTAVHKIESSSSLNSDVGYYVTTPIGNATLSDRQVISYQGQDYVSLPDLQPLGITADFSQQDLAIILNMGWRPSQQNLSAADKDIDQPLAIDYYPSRAGLLGLSFNSTFTASDTKGGGYNHDHSYNQYLYADIGAFGYGLGGVWGIKVAGYDDDNANARSENNNRELERDRVDSLSFTKTALDGLTHLPSDWQRWQVDNLYWSKSGQHLATRLGINQPNALAQGAQNSGDEFTGALVAFSNRQISRHLSRLDEDSRSLLQNTSQDYQHLTGSGQAGGVAELRINGQAIARVQIGLDGRYEFLNLDVSQLTHTDNVVEVAIYAYPLARQPLEVRSVFVGKRRTNVATNEWLLEAGLGRTGNLLSDKLGTTSKGHTQSHTAAHLYSEYGVNNRLAVRGGINSNILTSSDNDTSLSWHAGINVTPSAYSNADLSYAHAPNQDLWQAQLQYQRKKLWANYQYQHRRYDYDYPKALMSTNPRQAITDQRHQLLVSYRPNDDTSISLNQYYDDPASATDINTAVGTVSTGINNTAINNTKVGRYDLDKYYAYGSINHRFNDALNAGLSWNSREDRYGYRLLWQDSNQTRKGEKPYISNTVGLSGDNDSETLSVRHQLNQRASIGQSISHLHGSHNVLNQGDFSYRFDSSEGLGRGLKGINAFNNSVNIGYSAYKNKLGWQADWQLTHRNGVSFSLGYKHRYVDAISNSRYDDLVIADSISVDNSLPAWSQNNYLYAKLSFDMFKAPKSRLRFGSYPLQQGGSIIVDVEHQADLPIVADNMRFELNNQQVKASLIDKQAGHSQYLINNIKAGDYVLTTDAENLPLEYSASDLPTPRIRVSNHTPTTVPITLQKTFGISGQTTDAAPGIKIDVYQGDTLVRSITTGSYGYFQVFGLLPNIYTLKSQGYETKDVAISNDFVMQVLLESVTTHQ